MEPQPATLILDERTLADLGVFEGRGGAKSLFEFCNRTRTRGGSRALKARMRAPLVDVEAIAAVQAALRFMAGAEASLAKLPSAYLVSNVERYLRLPVPASKDGGLVAGLRGIALWIDDFRQFTALAHGVDVTRRFLLALRDLTADPRLADAPGALAPLLGRLRTHLAEPAFATVPAAPVGPLPWRTLALDGAFRAEGRETLRALVDLVYELDALMALADTARSAAWTWPELREGAVGIEAEDLAHPLLDDAVGNPVRLDERRRLLFLTGPNMAGKTTYLRAVAIAQYLAQLGLGVRATRCVVSPATHLLTAISLEDDLHLGVSYFRAEALRVRALADALAAGGRVLAVLDEPFKGTNVKDALDASDAVLRRLARCTHCRCIVSSHLIELDEGLKTEPHVDRRYFEAAEEGERLAFDYRLHDGVSAQRLGMRVLREEGVFELLDAATDAS